MAGQENLKNIVIWGGANESKSSKPVRWTHDYIIFASYADKLSTLENPSILIPYIFDKELDEISSKELYDGVFEYTNKEITVELVEGIEYTEYKIFVKKVDFDDSSMFYIDNIKDPTGFADRLLGYSLFHIDDLKDPAGFVLKIRDAGDTLSKYIREKFSAETQQVLDAYENDSYLPSDSLKEAFVNELNKLLKGENLYEEERFLQVKLTNKTKKLIENYPEGEELIRLNRLLLEEAYINEIAKSRMIYTGDNLSKYIRDRFSAETKKLLDAFENDPYPPSDSLKEALVNELNKLLKGENLYEEERFLQVKLTNKTKKLIENYPEGEELIRLNRLLMEEAYPNEIENNYFHAIIKRLIAAGAQMRKPEIPIEIPGRPPLVDIEQLNKQRYNYHEETLDKDRSLAKNMRIKAFFKSVFGSVAFVIIMGYLGMNIFITEYQEVPPPNSDKIFITAKGYNVVYAIGANKRFTVFKFAELIEEMEMGYDTTYTMYVREGTDLKTDEIIVDKMKKSDGETIYDIGNRIVETGTDPTDYNFENAKPFIFNAFNDGGDEDWSEHGSLDKGDAKKIILRARVFEKGGKYLALFGTTYAVLGTISEADSIDQFYELLQDDISYAAVLYSLKATKTIDLYGRIDKTLTSREGRNSVDRLIFNFHVEYARQVK